jgi:hypothetical protein
MMVWYRCFMAAHRGVQRRIRQVFLFPARANRAELTTPPRRADTARREQMSQNFPISRALDQHNVQLAPLVQRANAAAIDMALIGLFCFGLEWSMRVAEHRMTTLAIVCGAILAVVAAIEMLSGWTIGKSFYGLSIRTGGNVRPAAYRVILRGLVRWLPVFIFLPSLFLANDMLALLLWGISLTAVCCYICMAYLTLVRSGVTPFDMAADAALIKST